MGKIWKSLKIRLVNIDIFRMLRNVKCFVLHIWVCMLQIQNYNLRTAQETITNLFFFYSLWGKFGERSNKAVTHSITQPSHLFSLLEDPVNAIHSMRICSKDVMELVVTKNDDE